MKRILIMLALATAAAFALDAQIFPLMEARKVLQGTKGFIVTGQVTQKEVDSNDSTCRLGIVSFELPAKRAKVFDKVVEEYNQPLCNSVWMSRALAEKLAVSDTMSVNYAKHLHINGSNPEVIGGVYEDIPTRPASSSDLNQYSAVIIAKDEDLEWGNGIMIDVSGDYKETEKAILKAYTEFSKARNGIYVAPAQNGYTQDLNRLLLQPVKTAMRLLELFMVLSVLISLLGLIAMSTYYSGQNTKSIAVRKVFGSDVRRELRRTVKGYMMLVGIAAIIGTPIAVWLSGKYLERFAYRIEHYGWVFVVAVLLTALLAFLSVLWQTLRAARTNPAEALKKE